MLGKTIVASIVQEMKLEFPLSDSETFDRFFKERKYDQIAWTGDWIISDQKIK